MDMSVRWEKAGSAKRIADNAQLDLKCPECSTTIPTTYGAARRSPTVRCRNGHGVKLEASCLDKGLRELEKGLDGLFG